MKNLLKCRRGSDSLFFYLTQQWKARLPPLFFLFHCHAWPWFCSRPTGADLSLRLCSLCSRTLCWSLYARSYSVFTCCAALPAFKKGLKMTGPWSVSQLVPTLGSQANPPKTLKPVRAEFDGRLSSSPSLSTIRRKGSLFRIRGVCRPPQAVDNWSLHLSTLHSPLPSLLNLPFFSFRPCPQLPLPPLPFSLMSSRLVLVYFPSLSRYSTSSAEKSFKPNCL